MSSVITGFRVACVGGEVLSGPYLDEEGGFCGVEDDAHVLQNAGKVCCLHAAVVHTAGITPLSRAKNIL